MTVLSLTFLVGLALIVAAIFGGGIQVKEIRVPTLPFAPRIMSFLAGCVLLALCIAYPGVFPSGKSSAPEASSAATQPKTLGAAIRNHLISVRAVKRVLRHLGKYEGPIDGTTDTAYFQAVGAFQISQKIEADGLVGPETYEKLREAWPDFFKSR